MQRKLPILAGFTLMFCAACHKAAPVISKAAPPPPPPVAAPIQRPAATPARPSPPPQTARAVPPRPSAMTQQERESLDQSLARLSDALFDYDKTNIRPDALANLTGDVSVVKKLLSTYPNQKLIVEGSADERGSAEYNLALGDRRAHAAENFLVNQGIPQAQLQVVSYGKERPVCMEHDEACWQKNRRAHITAAP